MVIRLLVRLVLLLVQYLFNRWAYDYGNVRDKCLICGVLKYSGESKLLHHSSGPENDGNDKKPAVRHDAEPRSLTKTSAIQIEAGCRKLIKTYD